MIEKTVDERNIVPGILSDFKPGVYTPKKTDGTPTKQSVQEYLCRDCKRSFCRKGDRDNHEKRMGHERWRRGAGITLNFQ